MRVLLIDGTQQFLRHYVIVPTTTRRGDPNGGVFGFLRSLGYFLHSCKPSKIIIIWDGVGGSQKRRSIISEYKRGRKPIKLNRLFELSLDEIERNKISQRKRLAEYLKDLPVTQITVDNIEADDVIGYLVSYFEKEEKVIISSDKDFLQLLGEKTLIYRPSKRMFFTTKDLIEEYNIYPCNFALARAIVGDPSDNLRGVNGIGFKRIVKLFPFITEKEEITLDNFFDFCKKEGDKYQRFLEVESCIRKNYQVMQLYSPVISIQSIKKINDSLAKNLRYNATTFRVKCMEDQINELSDSYLTNFLPLKGVTDGHGEV